MIFEWDWGQIGSLIGVIGAVNGMTLWAIKVLLARQSEALAARFDALAERDARQDAQMEAIREDLAQHKLRSARDYMHREDAVMFFGRAEQKIDAIWQFLHERFARGPE